MASQISLPGKTSRFVFLNDLGMRWGGRKVSPNMIFFQCLLSTYYVPMITGCITTNSTASLLRG